MARVPLGVLLPADIGLDTGVDGSLGRDLAVAVVLCRLTGLDPSSDARELDFSAVGLVGVATPLDAIDRRLRLDVDTDDAVLGRTRPS